MPEQGREGHIDPSVLDHAPVAIIVTDLHGKIVDCNRHAERFYGLPRGQLVGAESAAFATDTVGPDLVEEIARAMLAGETWEGDFRVQRADGAVLEVHAVDSPLFDAAGRLDGIVSISIDITDRRRAEEAVRASEARKAAVLEAALDAVVSIDHDGRVTEFNPAAERIFECPAVDVVGRKMVDVIVPPSLREAHRLGFARYLETGQSRILGRRVELTGLRRDGREFPVELTVARIDASGPPAFTAFLRDITARRAAERDLRESRERLARLAWTLIESLLPGELPLVPGIELGAAYRPGGEGERVGGDFYDAFECTPGEWAVVVGDVCGKGPEAAALTALARYTTRAAALRAERPSAVLAVVNDAVLRHQPERFCTAIYARVHRDDGGVRVALATAGHPLPLHVPGSASVRPVGGHGRVLGVTHECVVADTTVDLAPGDALVLYTDGVTDARRGDERFGDERLRALLEAARGLDAVALARHVERAVLEFRGGAPQDDVAVVVVRASPSAGEVELEPDRLAVG